MQGATPLVISIRYWNQDQGQTNPLEVKYLLLTKVKEENGMG